MDSTGNPLEMHAAALAEMRRVVEGMGPDQLGVATPCAEWDARALLNHVVGGNRMAAALVAGEVPPDRNGDFLGEDPFGAFAASAEAAEAALRGQGVLTRTFRTPFGEAPGSVLAAMRASDVLIHAWDLARATGQPTDLNPTLCEAALAIARGRMAGAERKPGGPIGPEVAVPTGAPACDRYAGFMGRAV
ncbi:MAG: hypothetical protein AVDCRST_MAG19-2696 [uncultured Thermomicrobiales bacterium]|uniref:Mycothiol-dependent maleylpyruvate isomerase metal-binding domain-containing protein n=1 Tax=uncultured Thermomicrobiales bacterium TaxID=1645740 RepID=A0A6J4V8D5_9BACT|nr:MAG: hypothetical protein AVDCRST_MAG19-2696 [uncultured Thermomicrobiales bacterium]